jgi:hypothetical protein
MRKLQNRNMGNRRKQGNMAPQKVKNHTTEDLIESGGYKSLVSEVKRMVRMLKELKDDVLKQLNESQKNMDLKN